MKLLISLILLGTCNTVVKKTIYLNADTHIVSNNITATNILSYYTGFKIGTGGSFVISIKDDGTNGYSLRQINDTLFITGNTVQGVLYFLDKYKGIRFYMPSWTSKGKDSVLIDSNFTYNHTPFTPVIYSTGYKTTDEWNWAKYNNLVNYFYGVTQHSMSRFFYDSSALKLFPDVYKNGFPKSIGDQNFEPDFTNKECVSASIYVARKFFKANPAFLAISFSVMDSYNGYPAPVPGETLSQSYTNYINELADSFKIIFPGKKINYIRYGYIKDYPQVPLRDNVVLITVDHISDGIGDQLFDAVKLKAISLVVPNLGNHDWAEGYGYLVPRIYSHLLQNYLNAITHAGINFQFAHLEMYPNWGLDGMKGYEMAKIYDNPSINIDSIRTLFCTDMFGEAAFSMKGYFDDLERLSTSMNNNPLINRHIADYRSQMPLTVQDSTLASNARSFLNNALSLATGEAHQRVQFFSNGFRISEGLWHIYNQKDTTYINNYMKFITDSISGKQMYLNIATIPDFIPIIQSVTKIKKP